MCVGGVQSKLDSKTMCGHVNAIVGVFVFLQSRDPSIRFRNPIVVEGHPAKKQTCEKL